MVEAQVIAGSWELLVHSWISEASAKVCSWSQRGFDPKYAAATMIREDPNAMLGRDYPPISRGSTIFHRRYSMTGNSSSIYDDRLDLWNPGPVPAGLSLRDSIASLPPVDVTPRLLAGNEPGETHRALGHGNPRDCSNSRIAGESGVHPPTTPGCPANSRSRKSA